MNKQKREKLNGKMLNARRNFLKKAAYSAPSIMVLGSLAKPTRAKADQFGGPPSDPSGW
ncbi:hypothetical protein [Nitratifractor salsuginis]|uniref:hypothetical protein n=1 Tax=Nitratifractor salsuginis TaxID=269261 RepID=UPI00145D1352|nr:hypothetical protein [Nitratifractor salsuginis]